MEGGEEGGKGKVYCTRQMIIMSVCPCVGEHDRVIHVARRDYSVKYKYVYKITIGEIIVIR